MMSRRNIPLIHEMGMKSGFAILFYFENFNRINFLGVNGSISVVFFSIDNKDSRIVFYDQLDLDK